jgi:hydroxymethylglutaryl-CoA synthase
MTQGAGAVVMLLNDKPRLLQFDPKVTSTSIKDEYDFYRPFGKETPIVHGQYSNMLYMIQVRKALETYKKKVIATNLINIEQGETILDHMDYINMHLPYSNMGKKALAYLVRHEWRQLPRWKRILQEIGVEEPIPKDPRGTIESVLSDQEFMAKDHEFTKLFTQTDEYLEAYESKLSSSLIASSMIGNLYTASLYLGFRSSLEFEYQKGINLAGKRVGFGSYGSGSSAMVFSGIIQDEYESIVKNMNLETELGVRKRLTLEEYENLHENKLTPDKSMLNTSKEFILVDVKTEEETRGERRYIYNE